jgi:hypothetical protein
MTGPELERRYRLLLTAYPAAHRRVHGEEMLSVLLAASADGQHRPKLADAVNLVAGGLLIRVRALAGGCRDPRWRDALAVVSVVAPLLMLAAGLAASNVLGGAIRAMGGRLAAPFWLVYWPGWPATFWATTFGAGLLVLLVLLRLRRSAALTALAVTVSILVTAAPDSGAALAAQSTALLVLLGGLATIALAWSPGPARGLQILGWWRTALTGVGAVVLGALLWGGPFIFLLNPLPVPPVLWALIIVVCVGGVVTGTLRAPTGRRVMALLAIAAAPMFQHAGVWVLWGGGLGQRAALLYLPSLALTCLLITTVWVRRHRLNRPPPDRQESPGGGGLPASPPG